MIKISNKTISNKSKTFFVADIAANHDGSLKRAKKLIKLAASSGADAAKFQHFNADTIVSDYGFKELNQKLSHQSKWKKSVYNVYKDATINLKWTSELKEECYKHGIIFFTSPYSLELVNTIDKYVPAFKIGSGDITWIEIINLIAKKNKPILLATGASNIKDVKRAVKEIKKFNNKLVLMQCNTNYTASLENFKYINLNVLKTYKKLFPDTILGLSDHTPGHSTVLGAITLGARVIEKHFTDKNDRDGPDHKFSMNPKSWENMIIESRRVENALGTFIKKVEKNEKETAIVQRRSLRFNKNVKKNSIISKNDLIALRPCPNDAICPSNLKSVIGKKIKKNKKEGDYLSLNDL